MKTGKQTIYDEDLGGDPELALPRRRHKKGQGYMASKTTPCM